MSAKPYGHRDRIAAALCNWVMCHVASERYRAMIGGSIRYGLAAAADPEYVLMRPVTEAEEAENIW